MPVLGELCCVALLFCCIVVVALPFSASLGMIVHACNTFNGLFVESVHVLLLNHLVDSLGVSL